MSLPANLSLREATIADLPAIAAMRESVGWGVHEWALQVVIGHADARCVVAVTRRGDIAGVGSGIVYGPLGFIGNMVVADGQRRRGIGSAILDTVEAFLTDAGCIRLELNATADGRPLYERHGFASIGASHVARVPRGTNLAHVPSISVSNVSGADVERVAAFDLPRFGGDRHRVLEAMGAEPGTGWLIAQRAGLLVGYAGLRAASGRLGPIVADEPSIAGTLMATAFEREPDLVELRLNLPPGNRRGETWLRSRGVMLEDWDGRMAKGAAIPRRDETLYGMALGALG